MEKNSCTEFHDGFLYRNSVVFGLVIMLILASCPSEPEEYIPPAIDRVDHSPNAKRLLNYLSDQYGEKIISGQMDTAWTTNNNMDMIDRVFKDTGKYPALKGFDMMELPNSWSDYGMEQINEAIEWWEGKNKGKGASEAAKLLPGDIHGIVAFCWHWRVTGNQFYTNQTTFRIPWKNGKLDMESAAFQTLKNDLDKAAVLLKLLKDRDIPVLWRPLHEASGGWFWWGAKDVSNPAARCIALWEFMYDYLGNTKGLNNLIWVWNGQNADWFPFADTVDIVGYDVYTDSRTPESARNYASQRNRFNETRRMVPNQDRMVALTENGAIPDPDNCKRDNAMWSWFMTWNDDKRDENLSNDNRTSEGNFWTGEYHNTNAHKNKVYNHDLVITLDKLPDLTKYRL
jgi:mannan endo-1,4-beta-mannosidase